MKQQELMVLTNVIAVARRELADRDDKEIPARLRKVARYSGKRLPPPFARSVLKEIRESDGFRSSVQERWDEEDLDDPIGKSFLTDPGAGLKEVNGEAERRTVSDQAAELNRSRRAEARLEEQLEESKRRLVEANDMHTVALANQRSADAASRESLERSVKGLEKRAADDASVRDSLTHTIDSLKSDADDLRERLDRSVAKSRKKVQRDKESDEETNAGRLMSPPSDPIRLAAWLDEVQRAQRSFREARSLDVEAPVADPPLFLPDGLLQDTAESLTALIDQRPDVIYIDGYNVAALLVEEFSSASARTTVVAKADRLALASKARIVVVFDAVGVEGRVSAPTAGPSEVRFAHEQIADDEIVEMILADPSRAVVITSDRELSNRCLTRGCVTVWSEAFVAWAAS